jgi:hypothetical protein
LDRETVNMRPSLPRRFTRTSVSEPMQFGNTTLRLVSRTTGWSAAGSGGLPKSAKLTWQQGEASYTVPVVGHQGGAAAWLRAAPVEVMVDHGGEEYVVAVTRGRPDVWLRALAVGGIALMSFVVTQLIRRAG